MGNSEKGLVGVDNVVAHLNADGIKVECFKPSEESMNSFLNKVKEYRIETGNLSDGMLPTEKVIETALYKENLEWITKMKNEGYTIIDIGNPNNLEKQSGFYNMETEVIFGELK